MTVGWFVRVVTGEIQDGVYDTVVYIAGFETPEAAVEAVRLHRSAEGETREALDEITTGIGP
jgi:hypothetical protein